MNSKPILSYHSDQYGWRSEPISRIIPIIVDSKGTIYSYNPDNGIETGTIYSHNPYKWIGIGANYS